LETLQDTTPAQSSLYKMSDSGTNDSEYNGLPQMDTVNPNQAKKRGQKLVALDETELATKLQQLRKGRQNGRHQHPQDSREPGMRGIYVSEYQ